MDYFNQTWRIFFEAIPLIAACFTLILSLRCAVLTENEKFKRIAILFATSAILLIFAQSSWTWTVFVKRDLLGTDFANIIWTVFNSTVMLSMTYAVQWGYKK